VEFLVVTLAVAVTGLTIAAATLVVQRGAARKMTELDARLTIEEAGSGKCGACDGNGFRWEVTGRFGAGGARPCWRCHGTGEPPSDGDRARFMP